MTMINHTATGGGAPPLVFVHGFACAQGDWDAQVAHLSGQHRTVAVDLRAHGASPGTARDCSIERFGADVAEVMRGLALPPAILVGHSMGCRVVIEAALQAPRHTAAVVLVDGSQFAPAMEAVLQQRLATAAGFAAATRALFEDMFTPASDRATAIAVIERAVSQWGLPNGYVLGEEGSGAFVAGLRYGEGTLYTKNAGDLRVYWQGPSVGFDWGGDGARTMTLVYNLPATNAIYQRFGGIDGSAYIIGGFGMTALTANNIVLVPIRSGIGLRLGANIGYLKYTPRATWNPF